MFFAALLLGTGAAEAQTTPTVSSAAVNGATLTITFSEALDDTSTPANTAFTVNNTEADGSLPFPVPVTLSGTPSISGSTVTLTLASAARPGDVVTVNYAKPASNPLRASATGNAEVAAFTDQAVTNNTVLMVSSAWVSGTSLTIAFNANLDDTSTPANTAFTVKVDGNAVTLSGTPSISFDLVTLTLASAVMSTTNNTVTVSYTKPTSNPLRASATGNAEVASFTDQAVSTPPNFQSATVNGTTLTVTFDENLDTGSAPAGVSFSLYVGGSFVPVFGTGTASISGMTATVTFASAVAAGATVFVNYTPPSVNPLQDAAGNDVPSFVFKPVTNNTPEPETTPPTLLGGVINGSTVRLYFSEPMDTAAALTVSAFSLSPASLGAVSSPTWTQPTGETNILTLTAANAASDSQTVQISITTAAGLQDVAENDLAAVTSFGLTNLGGTDPGAPTLSTAEVDGDTLTLTYDQRLLPRYPPPGDFTVSATGTTTTVSSLAINPGTLTSTVVLTLSTPVKSTDTVTVSYSKAGAPRLQNPWGGQVVTLAGRAVTNNTAGPVHTSPPARIWSSWLRVGIQHGAGCADPNIPGDDSFEIPCTRLLTNNSFMYEGMPYRVGWVGRQGSAEDDEHLVFIFYRRDDSSIPVLSPEWTLHVDNRKFPVADASLTVHRFEGTPVWINPGFDWRAGQRVWLCLTTGGASCPTPRPSPPAANASPVADAGEDWMVGEGETVTLDGSESSDPDNDTLTYAWSVTGGTYTEEVALSDPAAASPTFTAPDTPGTIIFSLTVTDGKGGSDTDTVTVTVNNRTAVSVAGAGRVTEGSAGETTQAEFTVSLDEASDSEVTVDYATEDGTATSEDNDYSQKSGTLTFPAGEKRSGVSR